jgi:hypothetical protein
MMAADRDLTIAVPSEPAEGELAAVSLREAAERLGLTESEVLLRIFRGSLPSLLDCEGGRRVPLVALEAIEESDRLLQVSTGLALTAQIEALDEQVRDVHIRIGALEAREPLSPPPQDGRLEAMAVELDAARARITALESRLAHRPPPWLGYWEACRRWLKLAT